MTPVQSYRSTLMGFTRLARRTGTEDLLFKIRKNLFETLTFVARKP